MSIKVGDLLGSYQIEKHLSHDGGTAHILLGRHIEKPDFRAAIKIHLNNDRRFQDLLRREIDILRELYHPGIVRIYPQHINGRVAYEARASWLTDKPWYFAMEYISGPRLDQIINKQFIKQYPSGWIIELFYQILVTVYHLHRSGYAHCDLKPSNILLRYPPSPDSIPLPVLVDFGIATSIKKPPATLAGSLLYSPPEVILTKDRPDVGLVIKPEKIDIWGLGAIFFELLVGRPLINHNNEKHITTTIIQGQLDNLRGERPELSPALDSLLNAMISRDAARRPSVARIIKAIEEDIAEICPPRIVNIG